MSVKALTPSQAAYVHTFNTADGERKKWAGKGGTGTRTTNVRNESITKA